MELSKDGRLWRIGSDDDVRWITQATPASPSIESAIPKGFAAYATVVDPDLSDPHEAFAVTVLEHLTASAAGPWWLGYLDTHPGADLVFPTAPRVPMYSNWDYVFVLADPEQATSWRVEYGEPLLPEVIFPLDRSWLWSTLWDDSWSCVGGPHALIDSLSADNRTMTTPVEVQQDMTPPGHTMF